MEARRRPSRHAVIKNPLTTPRTKKVKATWTEKLRKYFGKLSPSWKGGVNTDNLSLHESVAASSFPFTKFVWNSVFQIKFVPKWQFVLGDVLYLGFGGMRLSPRLRRNFLSSFFSWRVSDLSFGTNSITRYPYSCSLFSFVIGSSYPAAKKLKSGIFWNVVACLIEQSWPKLWKFVAHFGRKLLVMRLHLSLPFSAIFRDDCAVRQREMKFEIKMSNLGKRSRPKIQKLSNPFGWRKENKYPILRDAQKCFEPPLFVKVLGTRFSFRQKSSKGLTSHKSA